MTENEQRDWPQIPGELLEAISRRFTDPRDALRFQSAVCRPWKEAVKTPYRGPLPLLALSCKHMKSTPNCRGCRNTGCHRFVDVAAAAGEKNIIHINLANQDDGTNVHCHGSAFGWLLLEERPRKPKPSVGLHFLNPFTRKKIPLPAETQQGGYLIDSQKKPREVRRFAMSADPSSTEEPVTVVLCYREKVNDKVFWDFDYGLAICKLGGRGRGGIDQRWTLVTFNPFEGKRCNLGRSSVVFWRDKVHVLYSPAGGRVLAIDLDGKGGDDESSMFSFAFLPAGGRVLGYHSCLVVSPEGELMLLNFSAGSNRFDIYKMNEDEKTWDEVETIGDYALFYKSRSAVYVSVKDHPAYRKNCVYFGRDVYDLGIRLLGDCQDISQAGHWIFTLLF